jgi:hypothetical protein
MAQETSMEISGIGKTPGGRELPRRRPQTAVDAAAPVALVPVRAVGAAVADVPLSLSSQRPLAAFLAQLIATQDGLPQTRARRRLEPALACATYVEAGKLTAEPGTAFTRRV